LNIMDRLVTLWNGFGSLLPLNILERDGYALEWVQFSPPIEHYYGYIGYILEWVWFSPPIEHYGEGWLRTGMGLVPSSPHLSE
jgi:hypothetical protein